MNLCVARRARRRARKCGHVALDGRKHKAPWPTYWLEIVLEAWPAFKTARPLRLKTARPRTLSACAAGGLGPDADSFLVLPRTAIPSPWPLRRLRRRRPGCGGHSSRRRLPARTLPLAWPIALLRRRPRGSTRQFHSQDGQRDVRIVSVLLIVVPVCAVLLSPSSTGFPPPRAPPAACRPRRPRRPPPRRSAMPFVTEGRCSMIPWHVPPSPNVPPD